MKTFLEFRGTTVSFSTVNKFSLHIYIKLATLVEGDPKAPFSIATPPRCWGGRDSFSWIAPLYPYSIPYNAEC